LRLLENAKLSLDLIFATEQNPEAFLTDSFVTKIVNELDGLSYYEFKCSLEIIGTIVLLDDE
jgi:hypothetical protein